MSRSSQLGNPVLDVGVFRVPYGKLTIDIERGGMITLLRVELCHRAGHEWRFFGLRSFPPGDVFITSRDSRGFLRGNGLLCRCIRRNGFRDWLVESGACRGVFLCSSLCWLLARGSLFDFRLACFGKTDLMVGLFGRSLLRGCLGFNAITLRLGRRRRGCCFLCSRGLFTRCNFVARCFSRCFNLRCFKGR